MEVSVAESIEQCKMMIGAISKDVAMSTVFTVSFDILKSLCLTNLDDLSVGDELDRMEQQRLDSLKNDPTRLVPLRRLIYALSEAINNTARVLVTKPANGCAKCSSVQSDVKQEFNDFPGCSIVAPADTADIYDPATAAHDDQLPGVAKEEPVEDEQYQNHSLFSTVAASKEEERADASHEHDNFEQAQPFYYVRRAANSGAGAGRSLKIGPGMSYDPSAMTFDQKMPVMVVCPLCNHVGPRKNPVARTLSNLRNHLKTFHRHTLLSAKLRMECACGYTTQNISYVTSHAQNCHNGSFTCLKNQEEPMPALPVLKCYGTTTTIRPGKPAQLRDDSASASLGNGEMYICPFCTRPVKRTLRNLEAHLKSHHKRSIKEAGLCFVCTCGYVSRTVNQVANHPRACPNSAFTMHHASA